MRGQVQILSVIMIFGIIIALVGVAYLWGVPLIEKRTTITDVGIMERFALDLDKKIIEVANNRGSVSMEIPSGVVKVIPYNTTDVDNNSIVIEFSVRNQMLFSGTTRYVETENIDESARYGTAKPRIITLKSAPATTGYGMKFKIHYRELSAVARGYKIALNDGGSIITGNRKISIEFDDLRPNNPEIKSNQASLGNDLVLTHISIDVF